jgi:hypothetical protein
MMFRLPLPLPVQKTVVPSVIPSPSQMVIAAWFATRRLRRLLAQKNQHIPPIPMQNPWRLRTIAHRLIVMVQVTTPNMSLCSIPRVITVATATTYKRTAEIATVEVAAS